MKESIKLTVRLFLITAIAGFVLAFANSFTSPVIKAREKAQYEAALKEVFADAVKFETVEEGKLNTIKTKRKNIEKIPVSIIMTRMPNIVHCFEDDNIMEAIEQLIKHDLDSLPVLRKEKGKLSIVGRFTKTNVTKLFYQELKNKSI